MPPQLPPEATPAQEAGEWLARADEDVRVAELTPRASPPLLGSSAYHSQQAAEKALKGVSRCEAGSISAGTRSCGTSWSVSGRRLGFRTVRFDGADAYSVRNPIPLPG